MKKLFLLTTLVLFSVKVFSQVTTTTGITIKDEFYNNRPLAEILSDLESKVGAKTYQMIDLSPTDAKKTVFKVRLSIDKATKQIANVVIFEKNGNTYTYNVKTFTPNAKVPETTFAFDTKKYPGVEVVDLR